MKKIGFLIFNIILGIFCYAFSSEEESSSYYWKEGIKAAREKNSEKAFTFLQKSFSKGIGEDSLYYLWAEIYLYKGALDTALALNLSIKSYNTSAIGRQIATQRYLIYSSLGWEKEAKLILDSLEGKKSKLKVLIPEASVYLSLGPYIENITTDRNYPYPQQDSVSNIKNFTGVGSLRLGWKIPVTSSHKIIFGPRLRFGGSRFAIGKTSAINVQDSTDLLIGGYTGISLFSDKFYMNYYLNRKRDFLGKKSFLHQTSVKYSFTTKNGFGSFELGYHYEFPDREHYYYLMPYFDWFIGRRNNLSFYLLLSGLSMKDIAITYSFPIVYVKGGGAYLDSLCSIPITNLLTFISDTLRYSRTLSQNFININPTIRYEYDITKRVGVGVATGYYLNWYTTKYEWPNFGYSSISEIPTFRRAGYDEMMLAYDTDKGQYFWVRGMALITNRVVLDTIPVTFNSKYRVDHSLFLNMFIKYFTGIGDIMIEFNLRRNFSNLMKEAPVDIERWYAEALLSWFFSFKPQRKI